MHLISKVIEKLNKNEHQNKQKFSKKKSCSRRITMPKIAYKCNTMHAMHETTHEEIFKWLCPCICSFNDKIIEASFLKTLLHKQLQTAQKASSY